MQLYINVPHQILKIDDDVLVSIGSWPYISNLRNIHTIRYDTEVQQGFASWQNPNLPSMDLSNQHYAEFVSQLLARVRRFLDYGKIIKFKKPQVH